MLTQLLGLIRPVARALVSVVIPPPSVPATLHVKASYGTRTRAARRSQGWLILTEDKLIFERAIPWGSLGRLFPSPNFTVDLSDIVGVQRLSGEIGDRYPFAPVLSITLASGGQLFIQPADIADWIQLLDRVKRGIDPPDPATHHVPETMMEFRDQSGTT